MVTTERLGGTSTLTTRLLETRGLVLFMLCAVFALLVSGYTSWKTFRITRLPDVSLRINDTGQILAASPTWAPVREGDTIVAVNGQPFVDGRATMSTLLAMGMGDTAQLESLRGTEHKVGRRVLTPMKWYDVIALWGRLFVLIVYVVLAIVVFVLRPGDHASWPLFFFSVSFGLTLSAMMVFYDDPRSYFRAIAIGAAVNVSLALILTMEFPRQQSLFGLPRFISYPLLFVPGVIATASVFLIEGSEQSVFARVSGLWQPLLLAGIFAMTLKQYRTARAGTNNKAFAQSRAILIAQWSGLIFPAALDVVRRFTWLWTENPWSNCYTTLPFILFVGITAYAAIAHNAFEVDRFTAAAFGYAVTLSLLTLFFVAVFLLFPVVVGSTLSSESPVVLVSIAGIGFLAFRPVHAALKKRIDVAFARQAPDTTRMTLALENLTASVQQATLNDTRRSAFVGLEVLQSTRRELWAVTPDGTLLQCDLSSDPPPSKAPNEFEVGGPLARAVELGAGGLIDLSPRAFPEQASRELASRGLAMAAPILIGGSLKGFVAVGRRLSGLPFRSEDLGFLNAIAGQLAIAAERDGSAPNRLGRYRLGRRLGLGGMAEVFEAWQRGPGGIERRVALKRPLPDAASEPAFIAKFLDEARISSQLQHPNIAQIHEVDVVAGNYFIAMEFIDGLPLRSLMTSALNMGTPPSLSVIHTIADGLLSALEYAHTFKDDRDQPMNIVHRDVTPANVLVSRRGEVKLVDFGIARATTQVHRTKTGVVQGTLPYISPENARGEPVDRRTDVYAAAALIYELITLKRAFPDGPLLGRPALPSKLVPGLPQEVDQVLSRGFAANSEERYQTAADFRASLGIALGVQKASAAEMSAWISSLEAATALIPERKSGNIETEALSPSSFSRT